MSNQNTGKSIVLHKCDQPGCSYETNRKSTITQHKADIHNIGVTWHSCEHCDYKTKQKSNLKSHKEFVHDIGKNECQFCYKNRNSTNKYLCEKTGTTSSICNKCYNSVTGKHTRKEKDWSDYLDKHLGVIGLLSSDKSLKSVGGCQMYRPDKLYTCINYVEIGECDEMNISIQMVLMIVMKDGFLKYMKKKALSVKICVF